MGLQLVALKVGWKGARKVVSTAETKAHLSVVQ